MAIAKPSFDLLLAFGLLAALSCKYDPRPPNGVQTCAGTDAGKQCPSGYECRAGKCYNTPADDGGLGLDAPQSVGGSGGNGAGGNAGAGDTMTSNPDSSAACGQLTQSCCANSQCTAGTVCNGASCVLCGASDQLCCAGNTCATAGLVCSGGSCVACGARTQTCCAGNALSTATPAIASSPVPPMATAFSVGHWLSLAAPATLLAATPWCVPTRPACSPTSTVGARRRRPRRTTPESRRSRQS